MLDLAVREVAEGGAGVFEGGGVGGVGGGEYVAGGDGVLHEVLAFFAASHCFFVLDLRLVATHIIGFARFGKRTLLLLFSETKLNFGQERVV